MGLVRTYTEAEIAKILKESEGEGLPFEGGTGHAERQHELVAVGRGREHTDVAALEQRVLDERKKRVGAFDGCQAKAIAWALNTVAGQTTLSLLNNSKVWYVFADISVANQNFRMKMSEADAPDIGPLTKPVTRDATVSFVSMKLMANGGNLHIRTAYPLPEPPKKGARCQVFYRGGGQCDQDLPI